MKSLLRRARGALPSSIAAERRLSRSGACSVCVALMVALGGVSVAARDNGFGLVVKRLRSEYRAKEQSLHGLGAIGRFVVNIVRPAGVKSLKFAIFNDLQVLGTQVTDFGRVIRETVPLDWHPLVLQQSRVRRQWAHVYSQPDSKHIKLLIVTGDVHTAFVAEVKIDPDKLNGFIDNPRILGVAVGAGAGARRDALR